MTNKPEEKNIDDVINEAKKEAEPLKDAGADSEQPKIDYQLVINDLNDKLLRAMADAQNTRRIAEIDIKKAKDYAVESIARDMVSVLENLYRALESIPNDEAFKVVREGVELTSREMQNALERSGIKRISPKGEPFNHNFHQAVSQIPDPNTPSGNIVDVIQAGYIIKDRVLKPALVVVSA